MPTTVAEPPCRLAIQNAIRQRASQKIYPQVKYNKAEACSAADVLHEPIAPRSVEVNEISSEFEPRAGIKLDRTNWTFQLILAFDCPVSLEDFEKTFADDPLRVCSGSNQRRCRLVQPVSAEYRHPPRQNPSNGSYVTYTFLARLG